MTRAHESAWCGHGLARKVRQVCVGFRSRCLTMYLSTVDLRTSYSMPGNQRLRERAVLNERYSLLTGTAIVLFLLAS